MRDQALVPQSIVGATAALDRMEAELDASATYERIIRISKYARAIEFLFGEVDRVKRRSQVVIAHANHRIGEELQKQPKAPPGPPAGIGNTRLPIPATQTEMVGNKMKASRLMKLASIPRAVVKATVEALHERGKDATVTTIIKAVAGDETKRRHEQSRATAPIPDGMDLRVGDCRVVLADIADNSVPLILTDPPYGDDAEPLYNWLARWASRVLIPGGSLICYTGQSRLNRDITIFDERLRYWWLLVMPHNQSQRLPGKFVIANFKPVLWYMNRRRSRSLVPDFLNPGQKRAQLVARRRRNWSAHRASNRAGRTDSRSICRDRELGTCRDWYGAPMDRR